MRYNKVKSDIYLCLHPKYSIITQEYDRIWNKVSNIRDWFHVWFQIYKSTSDRQ